MERYRRAHVTLSGRYMKLCGGSRRLGVSEDVFFPLRLPQRSCTARSQRCPSLRRLLFSCLRVVQYASDVLSHGIGNGGCRGIRGAPHQRAGSRMGGNRRVIFLLPQS